MMAIYKGLCFCQRGHQLMRNMPFNSLRGRGRVRVPIGRMKRIMPLAA